MTAQTQARHWRVSVKHEDAMAHEGRWSDLDDCDGDRGLRREGTHR